MQQIVSFGGHVMVNKLKSSILLSGAFVALLATAQVKVPAGLAFCDCAPGTQMDTSLPMSHTINRCALSQSSGVSWASWFSGSRGSKQVHYLDLLELLSRNSDTDPVQDSTPQS